MPQCFIEGGVYIETLTDVALSDRPVGSLAVPQRPSADHPWMGDHWGAPPPPLPPEPPTLTKVQWGVFLDTTGFRAACDAALAALPKATTQQRAIWAGMKNVIAESDSYRLPVALALVAQVRAMNLPGVTLPTDAEVTAAWTQAAQFSLASLGIAP